MYYLLSYIISFANSWNFMWGAAWIPNREILWFTVNCYYKWLCKLSEWKQTNRCYIFWFYEAFNKVPHQGLSNKLSHYGIGGSTLAYIQNYLTSRHQNVILEGICSYFCALWMIFLLLCNAKSDYMLMISYCTQR